jgi:hypothetical protein
MRLVVAVFGRCCFGLQQIAIRSKKVEGKTMTAPIFLGI